MERTVMINGRSITLRPGMRAEELKTLAGIDTDRLIIARESDGRLRIVPDHKPLPSPRIIDAPAFIYG